MVIFMFDRPRLGSWSGFFTTFLKLLSRIASWYTEPNSCVFGNFVSLRPDKVLWRSKPLVIRRSTLASGDPCMHCSICGTVLKSSPIWLASNFDSWTYRHDWELTGIAKSDIRVKNEPFSNSGPSGQELPINGTRNEKPPKRHTLFLVPTISMRNSYYESWATTQYSCP